MTFLLRALVILLLTASPALAQSQVRLWSIAETGVIDANGEALPLPAGARGLGTAGVQISGTFEGTLALQCSNDQATWTALRITPPNTTAAVTSVTTTGMWIGSLAGCQYARVVATAWTSGAANVYAFATSAGGGAGSGGTVTFEGEISAFNGVLLDAAGGDPITDATTDSLKVNVVAGAVTANLSATDNAVLDDIADGIAVTGTVTANLSATDNAVLDAIAVDTAFLETSKAPVAPGAATATTAFVIGGTYNAAGVTVADTQQAGLQLDADGNLLIASAEMLIELGNIAGALEAVDAKLNLDPSHANALVANGPHINLEAKTVDGSTLPNVVSEGQPVRKAGTIWGGDLSVAASPDGLYAAKIDPCASEDKTTTPFSSTADLVIISAVASKKNYICSIVFSMGATEIVSITEGTGSTCGTSEAALMGSTTDAQGLPFTDGGGLSAIGGSSTIIAGKTANVDTCLNVSGTERVAGFVTWVQR
jgi:hypothetical protein